MIILADFAALADVTPRDVLQKWCEKCVLINMPKEKDKSKYFCDLSMWASRLCEKCGGSGIDPDQSKWWEAVIKADMNAIGKFMVAQWALNGLDFKVFSETPEVIQKEWDGRHFIHRPENDDRPWPEVLWELVINEFYEPTECTDIRGTMEKFKGREQYVISRTERASFALATPETAPVFKSFGIKTLVEA